jgi:predicted peroxiredoxin
MGAALRGRHHGPRCDHMTQPLRERIARIHVGGVKIENCTPPTLAFRTSLEEVLVEEVAVGGNRMAARFSNGEVVDF